MAAMPLAAKLTCSLAALALALPIAVHPKAMAAQTAAPQTSPKTSILRLDPALDQLIAPGAAPERIATGFGFTEGPEWRHNRLWFVDGPDNKLRAVTPDGKVTDLLTSASGFANFSGPNGNAPAPDGSVVMCEQDGRRVVRLTGPDDRLKVETIVERYEGHRLNSPNDIIFARDGSFYFTDPPYGLRHMDKDPAKELPFNGVYHYKDGKLTLVIRDLTLPNGITLTPDGKTMYVANSGPHMMYMKYPVLADGTVGPGAMLIDFQPSPEQGVPDGLKLDAHGNLWASSPGGIRIITPEGKVLGQIKLPEVAANLNWGDDGKTLYITASHSVYKLRTLVHGVIPRFSK
ncbi:MAG TPA: SMP-30/gluconolactonase/LRE family protein [Acidobacteriaceae bacterium]